MSKKVANKPRIFYVFRLEDVSGVSGTGLVAEGVRFTNGKVAITWRTEVASVTVYDSMADALRIHTHGDKTRFYWIESMSYFNPQTRDTDGQPRPPGNGYITYLEVYEPGEFKDAATEGPEAAT